MKKILTVVLLVAILGFCRGGGVAAAENAGPRLRPDGGKWRFGCLQGGDYQNYRLMLGKTIRALQAMGWIAPGELPSPGDEAGVRGLWNRLAAGELESEYIEFAADAFWSADWDEKRRAEVREKVLRRLNRERDIDVMLALGTWAGQDLANGRHSVRTFVLSSTDSIAAGIVPDSQGSGFPHVHSMVTPRRHKMQLSMFHELIGFKKLGVAYEHSPTGRTYAAMDEVEAAAQECGFEIVSCDTVDHTGSEREAFESVMSCYEKLCEQVDALYITYQKGVTKKTLPALLEPLFDKKIPTFSQAGVDEVRKGVLLSLGRKDFASDGAFHARAIARSLNGVPPGSIDMVFQPPRLISINLGTARLIGYDPPVQFLGTADVICTEIEVPPEPGEPAEVPEPPDPGEIRI